MWLRAWKLLIPPPCSSRERPPARAGESSLSTHSVSEANPEHHQGLFILNLPTVSQVLFAFPAAVPTPRRQSVPSEMDRAAAAPQSWGSSRGRAEQLCLPGRAAPPGSQTKDSGVGGKQGCEGKSLRITRHLALGGTIAEWGAGLGREEVCQGGFKGESLSGIGIHLELGFHLKLLQGFPGAWLWLLLLFPQERSNPELPGGF